MIHSDDGLRAVLQNSRTVAVLGAHSEPSRPAYYVPEYLQQQGYRILPVNPRLGGERLFDQPVRASLTELEQPVDIVDVFRRGDALPDHVEEILGMTPRPNVVWFQLGIHNDAVAKKLEAEGIAVVQNRCALAEHKRLGIGAVDSPTP